MKYLRVQCTPNLASADIGCATVHSPSMYSKIVWWFFSLSACSLHYPIFQNIQQMIFCWVTTAIQRKNPFDKLQRFAEVENCLQSSLLEEAVAFLATDGWIPGRFEGQTESNFPGRISRCSHFFPGPQKRLKNPTYCMYCMC